MAVNSKQLKENGTQFYPETHIEAVIDGNGTTLDSLLSGKQATLVSGTNIKTVNNNSLLGNGNIAISGAGTLNTTATTAQSTNASESLTGSVTLHKVAKTGTYSDLIGTPTIPSAPGTLITNATTAQSASSGQAMSGTITLHKVSKTGTYSDLIGTPTIPIVNNSTITIQMNGATVDTFTTNASSAKTINLGGNYVKYELVSALPANPDSGTLYLIAES